MSESPASDTSPVQAPEFPGADEAWTHSAAGLCVVCADGKVQRANPAFAEIVGYAVDELIGMPLIRLHPAEHAMAMQALHRAIIEDAEPSNWANKETYFTHRQGRPVVAYTRNARVVTAAGEACRLITLVNLADAAEGDERIKFLHKLENYTALSSTVSNDLNNLLSIVLGYTALLKDGSTDIHRQRIVAEGVEGAVNRATSLVKQSLYMIRRPEPVFQRTDLARFLENRLQLLRPEISDRPIELELALVPELKEVPLDAVQLGEAVGEMIRRLHSFEPNSTRGLRTRTRWESGNEVRNRFSQADAGTYAVIELINPGRPRVSSRPPMPPADAPSENRKHDLGRTMIERIVQTHRGFVHFESEQGGSAAYTIWLPLGQEAADEELEPVLPHATAETPPPGTGKLMVVDDEVGLLATMASSLRAHGYEVVTAMDGESALLEFKEHGESLDLVVTDLVLPGMSGWEVFTGIREQIPDLPILIMSGHLEPKLEAAVQRSGAAGFVQKPFSLGVLLRRVSQIIAERRSARK
ncbi:MAG: PAS domain-containing sensor histidine kinase [Synoicihabitans sp.]